MNKLIVILISLLVIVSGANGFLYWQHSEDLAEVLVEIDTLGGQVTSLESTISSFSGDILNISSSISILEGDISALEKEVTTLDIANYAPINVVSRLAPSIVRIETDTNRTPGTGVIITENGYVMTNSHVIEGGTSIHIILSDGQIYSATVVGDDPGLDLAILEIDSNLNNFPAATLGNYEDITIGEDVLALGFPYSDDLGAELAATIGIVSAIKYIESYGNEYIQTDAEISLGFGGGPLVNMRGEVIGINTWGYTAGEGLGFAIPVNDMKDFIEDTIEAIG